MERFCCSLSRRGGDSHILYENPVAEFRRPSPFPESGFDRYFQSRTVVIARWMRFRIGLARSASAVPDGVSTISTSDFGMD